MSRDIHFLLLLSTSTPASGVLANTKTYFIARTHPQNPVLRFSIVVGVQSLSYVLLFVTPGTAAHLVSLSFMPSLFKFLPIELVMPSNHLILCLFLLLLPSVFPSIRVFPNELALHMRWQKNWSFSFSIISSNEYSRLISFRIYWFDLLAIQGTLKSLLQHHRFKSISSSVISLLYGPTLTSIDEYWKNHNFD